MKKIALVLTLGFIFLAFTTQKQMDKRNEIAQRYYQILDNGKADQMNELLATTLIDHDGHGGNAVEEIKGLTLALKHGFTNAKHELEIIERIGDDKIFVRWRMTGTHTGEFFGAAASQKAVDFVGHDLFRVEAGKIVEVWHVENLLGMFEQMKSE
jgi:predicted ester cyclase